MTSDIGGPPREPDASAAVPVTSGWARLAGVLFAPVETFREIARRPDILVPLGVIVLIAAIGSIVIAPRVDFETAMREEMAQSNPNLSTDDTERMVRMTAAFAKAMVYVAPLLNVVIFAAIAGILLLVFRMFGGEGTYKQAFSATLYSWMPLVIQGIVGIIVVLGRRSVSADELSSLVMSNLGFLVDMESSPVAYSFLSSIDIFTIWSVVLFIIGFSAISLMSRGRSAAIILSLWSVMVLIKVGFTAVFAGRATDA